jgi:hypothetical protein
MEPDTINTKSFIRNNLYGIFSLSKNELFINFNELEHKYAEPNKQEDKII